MSAQDDRRAELLRRFEAVIADAGLEDLRQLAGDLSLLGAHTPAAARHTMARPDLRRTALSEPRVFRVRVDLKGSRPPIWRRLDIRSDLTLDVVHRVLQSAFSWTDTHLWRFSLGGDPFDRTSQLFLCQWDIEEAEWDDAGGISARDVRLDETLQEPGEVLSYAYDYGDGWELRLRLEHVRPTAADTPPALVIDGRCAAPPEDCGGVRDGEGLAEILEDPEEFELDVTNAALGDPFMLLTAHGFDRRLADLVYRLGYTSVGEDLGRRALSLLEDPGPPDEHELRTSFEAYSWFLDRAADGGIPLTAAGYLKPIDVQGAAQALPTMAGWIGKANRENETTPVLHFRKLLQSLGLIRKHKGAFVRADTLRRHRTAGQRRALEPPRGQARRRSGRVRR